MEYTPVSSVAFAELEGVDDWRFILGVVHATFAAGSYPAAADLVVQITEAAERLEHHPDIDIRYPGDVHVALTTHAVGRITTLDVDLARAISQLAAAAGAESRPRAAQYVESAIDTMDADRIRPFWLAVLGYVTDGNGNLVDPNRITPSLWFQQMDEPRLERNRIHFDVVVPHDEAEARVAAALAAGGTLVSDRRARAFWVLADADGNEVCVCTWQDRM